MLILQSRSGRRRHVWLRRLPWILVPVLAIAAWLAYQPLHDALSLRYRLWKQRHALAQAHEFLDKHDAPDAEIALRVAIVSVPGNVEILREVADLLEQVSSPEAIRIRRTIAQLEPNSPEDQAAFVLCCLKFNDLNSARDALSQIPPKVADTPVALNAALAFAISTGNRAVADVIYQELEKSAPQSEALRYARAQLRLKLPPGPAKEAARKELADLAQADPRVAAQVHREFAADAIQNRDYAAAERWLALVLADPSVTMADRLQQANLDLLVDKKPFASIFPPLAAIAAKNHDDIVVLARWLVVQNRASEAEQWLSGLPPAVRELPDVKYAEADCVAQLKDWDRLLPMVEAGVWGPVKPKALKLAEAAKTIDSTDRPALRRDTWDLVLDASSGDFATLRAVERLAALWNWDDETMRSLWALVHSFPDQTWAAQILYDQYRRQKNVGGMRDVMETLHAADGAVPRYTNDWALFTMLTDPTRDWNPAKEATHRLYLGGPANPVYRTNYAFALAQTDKGPEALAIVAGLSPADRDDPARQPYLAFIYGVANRPQDLSRAVRISQGQTYLTEEQQLFSLAQQELERHARPKPAAAPHSS
jgi:predicted Zn-dependent protease